MQARSRGWLDGSALTDHLRQLQIETNAPFPGDGIPPTFGGYMEPHDVWMYSATEGAKLFKSDDLPKVGWYDDPVKATQALEDAT